MDFPKALQELAAGNPVSRALKEEGYLDVQFEPNGEYTVNTGGMKASFDILRWNGAGPVYEELTEEDKAATDWQIV